jgi:hypothetical protein
MSTVNPKYKGHGLGKQLYRAALLHHGRLTSGSEVSPRAQEVWHDLDNDPAFRVDMQPYGYGKYGQHNALYAGGGDPKKMFPKVKLTNKEATKKIATRQTKKKRRAA